MSDEKWKWINEYIGKYKISSHGRVLSTVATNPKLLTPITHVSGHIKINLVGRDKKVTTYLVSRLVMDAFGGGDRPGHNLIHLDGDITNNDIANLQWADTDART